MRRYSPELYFSIFSIDFKASSIGRFPIGGTSPHHYSDGTDCTFWLLITEPRSAGAPWLCRCRYGLDLLKNAYIYVHHAGSKNVSAKKFYLFSLVFFNITIKLFLNNFRFQVYLLLCIKTICTPLGVAYVCAGKSVARPETKFGMCYPLRKVVRFFHVLARAINIAIYEWSFCNTFIEYEILSQWWHFLVHIFPFL